MKDITDDVLCYKKEMETFIDQLDSEKKYFKLTVERVLKWELIAIETVAGEVVAIGGLEKKFGTIRSNLILRKDVQGQGLGKRFLGEIIKVAREKHHAIWALIMKENTPSLKLHLGFGYRLIGERQDLLYLMIPLSAPGYVYFCLVRGLFPLVRIVDLVRH